MRRLFHTNDNRCAQLLKATILIACVHTAPVIPSPGRGLRFWFPSLSRGEKDGPRAGRHANRDFGGALEE